MSLKVLKVFFVVLLCILTAQNTLANKTVNFEISSNETCKSSESVDVKSDETLDVKVTGKKIKFSKCVSDAGIPFLTELERNRDKNGHLATASITNPSNIHNGKWNCTFHINVNKYENASPNVDLIDGRNFTRVSCYVQVNVTATSSWTEYYMIIGGVVGAVVVIIIIVQTIIIIRYKSRNRLKHLDRPATTTRRKDEDRYSQLPARKRSAASSADRETSAIYQSVEDIRSGTNPPANIKGRPPMPLPHEFEDSDVDWAYAAKWSTPSSTRKKENKSRKNAPKPAPKPKPVDLQDMEDYDYADSIELGSLNRSLLKNAMPVHGRPDEQNTTAFHQTPNGPLRPQRAFTPSQSKRPLPPPGPKRSLTPPGLEPPFTPPGTQGRLGPQGPFGSLGRKEPFRSQGRKESFGSLGRKQPLGSQGPKGSFASQGPPGVPCTPVISELNNILRKRNHSEARAVESAAPFEASPGVAQKTKRNVPSPAKSPSPQRFKGPGVRDPQGRENLSPTNTWQSRPQDLKPKMWSPGPNHPQASERPPRRYGGPQGVGSHDPRCNEDQRQEIQERAVWSPQPNRRMPEIRPPQVTSPPLPRKIDQGGPGPELFAKRPPPPIPLVTADTDSEYEQIGTGGEDSDDEWQMEEIAPYHIYNI